VFGYGSLPAEEGGVPCRLRDHRRGWDVAMDNRETIPGYKVYLDPETGEQPPVHVAYLSITPHAGAHVDGYVFPVTDEELAALDERERNYERRDVSAHCDLDGRVGTAVVSRGYLEKVSAAPDLPVRRLLRRDIGP
jgi:cation transport regulator ChaC